MKPSKLLLLTAAVTSGFCVIAAPLERIPPGVEITVRTNEPIDARSSDTGRVYNAVVARDVIAPDGSVAVPAGSNAELLVRDATRHDVVLDIDSVTVNGRRYAVSTVDEPLTANGERKEGVGENHRTAKFLGGGAVLGTIVGAIAGGGRGAAIGAIAGAGAGAAAQTETRGGHLHVPVESLITFRLNAPLRIDERDTGYMRDGYHYHPDYDQR